VKKAFLVFFLFSLLWSCATFPPPPPSLYIDSLPASLVTSLSLEERIAAEEAWSNLKQGKANKAEKIISRLGAKSPIYAVGLGYTHFLLNNLQAAEESFKEGLKDYPDLALIHLGLAQVYKKASEEDLAFAEFSEVLKIIPDHPFATQEYETLRTKKTEEFLNEARVSLEEGKTEKAKEAYLKALHYSPKWIEAHLTLAEIYRKENRPQNALVHLQAAYSLEPKNKKILKDYADTLSLTEKYSKSLEVYERLKELDPKNKEVEDQIESLKNRLGIYELPSQYETIPSIQAVTKEDMAALLALKFRGILDETPAKPPIIVDIATSWASKFILKITSLGILDVYENHTFQPKKVVTRAEMAEILLRFINLLKKKGYRLIPQFPAERVQVADVSPDNYYYQPIAQIISYQIMDLDRNRNFRPELSLSGKEATDILDLLLDLIK